MVAANEVMRREVVAFLGEYRLSGLGELAQAIYARSESYMRKAIRQVPNGVYTAEMALDGIDSDIVLRAAVHVRDDSIHVDYAGTSPQVEYGINVAPHYRIAHSLYALKCLLDPASPNNEGCTIPCTDEAPKGSILNPRATAAGAARNLVGHTIPSLIFRALADVLPGRVQADSGGRRSGASTALESRRTARLTAPSRISTAARAGATGSTVTTRCPSHPIAR